MSSHLGEVRAQELQGLTRDSLRELARSLGLNGEKTKRQLVTAIVTAEQVARIAAS